MEDVALKVYKTPALQHHPKIELPFLTAQTVVLFEKSNIDIRQI